MTVWSVFVVMMRTMKRLRIDSETVKTIEKKMDEGMVCAEAAKMFGLIRVP